MKKKGLSQKEMARMGGLARAKKLSAEQRHEIASLGGRHSASNKKLKKLKKRNGKTNGK